MSCQAKDLTVLRAACVIVCVCVFCAVLAPASSLQASG